MFCISFPKLQETSHGPLNHCFMAVQFNRAILSNEFSKICHKLLKNEINIISFQTSLHEVHMTNFTKFFNKIVILE